jgi:hypothetical protein
MNERPERSPLRARARVDAPGPLAVKPAEAARLLSCSRDFFDEHVLPELKCIRRGRLVLVPVRSLERWLEANAERTL